MVSWCEPHKNSNNAKGFHDIINYLDEWATRLNGVIIDGEDALQCIERRDKKSTFYYVDPPYVHGTRSGKNYKHEMDDVAHEELLRVLICIQGKCMISGYRNDLYDNLLGNWRRVDFDTYADANKKTKESIWMNF